MTMTISSSIDGVRSSPPGHPAPDKEQAPRAGEALPSDGGEGHDPELIRAINAAYKVILGYVENYRFSFAEEEFYEQNPMSNCVASLPMRRSGGASSAMAIFFPDFVL